MKASSIILFCCAALALGQSSAGTFTATAAMAMARYGHTATFLNNGQVLTAGGRPNPTGSMTTARIFHTASLLPDSRVLIAGGDSGNGENILRGLTTAEVYDPSTGTVTATSEMIHGRECAKAHVLNNGKVLLSGGSDFDHVPDAELYDPTIGSFANAGAYATDPKAVSTCSGAASTLLPDGRVLIVWEDDLAEIYDPEQARSPRPANRSAVPQPRPGHRDLAHGRQSPGSRWRLAPFGTPVASAEIYLPAVLVNGDRGPRSGSTFSRFNRATGRRLESTIAQFARSVEGAGRSGTAAEAYTHDGA